MRTFERILMMELKISPNDFQTLMGFLFFRDCLETACSAVLQVDFSKFLFLEHCLQGLHLLYALKRGVKNRGSLITLRSFLMNTPNTSTKGRALKPVILACLYGLP